ncbi:MAG: DUF2795 domain-containing protein [Acidimicrobiia bacterium]
MPNATKRDYEVAFAGLDFPTSKAAVINRARDNGGIDREVCAILSQLPDRSLGSVEELQRAVRAIYVDEGAPPDSLPV